MKRKVVVVVESLCTTYTYIDISSNNIENTYQITMNTFCLFFIRQFTSQTRKLYSKNSKMKVVVKSEGK
jgi:hypothetical protein